MKVLPISVPIPATINCFFMLKFNIKGAGTFASLEHLSARKYYIDEDKFLIVLCLWEQSAKE
jgi:hypothetical protein